MKKRTIHIMMGFIFLFLSLAILGFLIGLGIWGLLTPVITTTQSNICCGMTFVGVILMAFSFIAACAVFDQLPQDK